MTEPRTLVLATRNEGKIAEIRDLLAPLGWNVASMADYDLPSPPEDAGTFEGNARLKAEAVSAATGLWALADDSGLEVAALGGLPGVETAHYGGWEKLLDAMKDVPEPSRAARFLCVLALCRGGSDTVFFTGVCEGSIASEGLGQQGFGYDPVFVPTGDGRTFAQMDKREKSLFSHRGRALKAFLEWARTAADAR